MLRRSWRTKLLLRRSRSQGRISWVECQVRAIDNVIFGSRRCGGVEVDSIRQAITCYLPHICLRGCSGADKMPAFEADDELPACARGARRQHPATEMSSSLVESRFRRQVPSYELKIHHLFSALLICLHIAFVLILIVVVAVILDILLTFIW